MLPQQLFPFLGGQHELLSFAIVPYPSRTAFLMSFTPGISFADPDAMMKGEKMMGKGERMKEEGSMKKDEMMHKGDTMKKEGMMKKDAMMGKGEAMKEEGSMKKDEMMHKGDKMKKDAMMNH